MLGIYKVNGKDKVAAACKDFTSPGIVLQDFASLKNTIIDSEHNGYGTDLLDIVTTLHSQHVVDAIVLKDWFFDMFIVDALIGNWDRHNGNWGLLYNTQTDIMSIAPVFDCGSCLYPQANEVIMQKTLDESHELNFRIFAIPTSGIKINNQKVNYFNFISSLTNNDCNEA